MNKYIKAIAPSINSPRPSWFPPRPDLSVKGIYWLIKWTKYVDQKFAFRNHISVGTNVYLDGVLHGTTTAYTFYNFTLQEQSTTGFIHNGEKYSWLFFDVDGLIERPNILLDGNGYGPGTNGIIEEIVNVDTIQNYGRVDKGYGAGAVYNQPQIIYFRPGIIFSDMTSAFMGLDINQNSIENFPTLRGGTTQAFRDSGVELEEYDCTYVTNLITTWYTGNFYKPHNIKCINTQNVTNISYIGNVNTWLTSFSCDDLSNCTSATYAFDGATRLASLILTNLPVSFGIANCQSLTKDAIRRLIASLADMTGSPSPTIDMTYLALKTDVDIMSDAAAKNWTIV